ncbi:MAG: Rieske 2Fe-2S domain-containing protein [Caldilineaceae bacterium]
MATIFELTGEEREQRIAELKSKMLEAYRINKAAHEQGAAEAPVAVAEPVAAAVATAEPVAAVATAVAEAPSSGNGVAVAQPATAPAVAPRPAAPRPAPAPKPVAAAVEEPSSADMTRREFMTYAWGAALGLLTAEVGLMSYVFMYPRFKAGEFGGKFFLKEAEIPPTDAAPIGYTAGKFWLVSTENGPKAIYMVCTHLGCLYKWAPSNFRFECPCHGSKFSHDGFYIEGPAPRSLDYFAVAVENGQLIVDTGKKQTGDPSSQSPARAAVA